MAVESRASWQRAYCLPNNTGRKHSQRTTRISRGGSNGKVRVTFWRVEQSGPHDSIGICCRQWVCGRPDSVSGWL